MAGWDAMTMLSKTGAAAQDGRRPPQSAMDVLSPLLFGHAAAMTLKAAVELNIPDILARAEPQRHLSVHEIAAELPSGSVDELSLHRVMRALVHLGVFSADQVESHSSEPLARYGLTPASRMLVRENNPGSLAPMVMYLNYKSSQTPWQHLHETILCGKNPFKVAYGKVRTHQFLDGSSSDSLRNKGLGLAFVVLNAQRCCLAV
ncbi:hypothetical protein KC19_5G058800 [Ceratodon purpureus]|uniref:O-methyltransferase dimerisation domain-containing protein n=1 Tax=Ceratodon purpureus TaxID=3225 RepID=A0A8T0HZE3_CERPU|nr:hypothetical protein KC19_5G058800 [Ceratodon purpureus]